MAACEQSGRNRVPQVLPPQPLRDWLAGLMPPPERDAATELDRQLLAWSDPQPAASHTLRADGLDVPVIPMALTNLWGSYFSRIEQGGAMVRPFRRGAFSRVGLNVGAPLPGHGLTPEQLRERVALLLAA